MSSSHGESLSNSDYCDEEECLPKVDVDFKGTHNAKVNSDNKVNNCEVNSCKVNNCFVSSDSNSDLDDFSQKQGVCDHAEDLHGNIPFQGITRETKAKFMLISEGKSPEDCWALMQERWGLKKPSLIISVIGGAKDFHLDERIEECFKTTIRKACSLPDACIITGGTYTGIMKIVSDALEDCAAVCLGISAWNELVNREVSVKNDTSYPYVVGSWLSQNGLYLDYKHTHFLLINEIEQGKGETLFRSALERYILDVFQVPSVLVVVNGGYGTLTFIHEVVLYSPRPVVVIEKSGRVADLIVYGIKNWDDIMAKTYEKAIHRGLYSYMRGMLMDTKGSEEDDIDSTKRWLQECYNMVIQCLQRKNLFRLGAVGTENDIDVAVMSSLLAGKRIDTFSQMKMTLLWDRADYARNKLFSSSFKFETGGLNYMMVMALMRGSEKYVKLLMDYGVNLHNLLTIEILEFLYGYQAYEGNFLIRKYIDINRDYKDFEGISESDRNSRKALHKHVIQTILNTKLCNRLMDNEVLIFNVVQHQNRFQDPFWELFMWAVICNIPEMAEFLWSFGRDQMAKALIAAEVWHVLGTFDGKRHKRATVNLSKGSTLFKSLAYELLDQCCVCNEKQTIQLCATTLSNIPSMTCLDIAVAVEHYEFVAHNSIQMLLADVWTGHMKTKKVKMRDYVKITFAILFPFLIMSEMQAEYERKDYIKKKNECSRGDLTLTLWKLQAFYLETPAVNFMLHLFSCLFFLTLYSYVTIMKNISVENDVLQMILVLWVIGYMAAEIYQVSQYDAGSVKAKISTWYSSYLNRLDLFNLVVFFVAWGLSFDWGTLPVARTLHAINCGCWILRLSTVLRVNPTLSLYLEMIAKMMQDLIWFLFILLTFVLAYGVTSTALLFPGIPDSIICLQMFLRSWFNIFGEHFIDMPPDDNTTHLISPKYNTYDEYVSWVIMGVYLLLTNILLLNIIIAAFNTTFADIQVISTNISKFRQYDLVVEYSKRASTPPPLSLIHHFILFVMWIVENTCRRSGARKSTKLHNQRVHITHVDLERLQEFEYYCAMKIRSGKREASSSEGGGLAKVVGMSPQDVMNRVEKLEDRMLLSVDKMEEKMKKMDLTVNGLDKKLDMLADKMEEKMEKMDVTVNGLDEKLDRLGSLLEKMCQTLQVKT